jgi:cell division protein FtsB
VSRFARLPLTPVVVCAAILAATYFAFSTWHYITHNYRLSRDENELRSDIARLDQEHQQLVAVRDYLKSDEYIEDIARRILGLVRPGETLVIVSSSAPPAATATPAIDDNAPPGPWWQDLFVQPAVEPEAAPTPAGQ